VLLLLLRLTKRAQPHARGARGDGEDFGQRDEQDVAAAAALSDRSPLGPLV
jgi:hypothetical protein